MFPSGIYASNYTSGYPGPGETNPTAPSEYFTQVPPQTQEQYYPAQAAYEQQNINASYPAPPNYNESMSLQYLQARPDKIEKQ